MSISSAGSSDPLVPKSLTVTNESYDLSYTTSQLYWTYTAVKADNYFKTGQVTEETWVSTDDDGNAKEDLPSALPGKFSVGDWVFTFNAYTSDDMTTDDDDDGVPDSLYYQGTGSSVTLSSGGENTVSVTVELYEAVRADEDGNTYGTLVVYGITFTNQDGDTQTLSDITLWYLIDDGTLTEDADQAMLASSSESGLTFDELEPGSHTFSAYVTDTSGNVLASGSASALVKPNLTTTITGDIEEAEDATTSVTLGDLSVSYGSISVSSEAGLTAALADSEVSTVVLSSGITLTSALSITSDTTIDLNENTITAEDTYAFVLSEGASLTISGGTVEAMYPFVINGDNTSLTIEDGTYETDSSNGGYYVVYIPSGLSGVEVTINGGSFESNDWCAISAYSGTVNINGGEFSGDYNIMVYPGSNTTYNITGGEFSADGFTLYVSGEQSSSDDSVAINISGGTFNGEVFLAAGYATSSITGGTFYGENGMQALHVKSGSISITGGDFYHANYYSDSDKTTVNESYSTSSFGYDYFFTGSGSMDHDEAIVIEANHNYSALTSVTLGKDFTANSGVLYVIDPDYDTSTKGTITESISSDRTDVQQYTSEDLIYKREVSGVGTAYFTSLTSAQGFTSFDYGAPGELQVQDSSSSTGWSTYSSSEE